MNKELTNSEKAKCRQVAQEFDRTEIYMFYDIVEAYKNFLPYGKRLVMSDFLYVKGIIASVEKGFDQWCLERDVGKNEKPTLTIEGR